MKESLSLILTLLALYDFVRLVLSKRKRKRGPHKIKHDPSKAIGKSRIAIETENGIEFRTVANEEYWKQMAKLTDKH